MDIEIKTVTINRIVDIPSPYYVLITIIHNLEIVLILYILPCIYSLARTTYILYFNITFIQ